MNVNHHEIDISNPDKLIFPNDKITKKDLVEYYQRISKYILPYMKNRPITMQRFPDGIEESGFYMKDAPDYFPQWIDRIEVEKKGGGLNHHVACNQEASLVYIANQACITPHLFLSKKGHLSQPDRMVFDFDPSTKNYQLVKKAALALKGVLDEYDIQSYVMNTGSEGIHVIVPLEETMDFDEVRDLARIFAEKTVDTSPDDFTLEQRKEKRGKKVFIDILRNAYGQTSVAPYALRAKNGGPVATPLTWQELSHKSFDPQKYTIKNIFKRLGQIDQPWSSFHQTSNHLKKIYNKLRHES